jgi:hypothetical protein
MVRSFYLFLHRQRFILLLGLLIFFLLISCTSSYTGQFSKPISSLSPTTSCGKIHVVQQSPAVVQALYSSSAWKASNCFTKAFLSCTSISLNLEYLDHSGTRNDTYWFVKEHGSCGVLKRSVTRYVPPVDTHSYPQRSSSDTCQQVKLQHNGLLITGCAKQGSLLMLT